MYLGGIPTVEPILERPGQVHSDDFVGCIQSLSVNGRTLNLSNALQSRGITNTCHRRRDVCDAHNHKCGVGGTCVDRWSNATCVCHGGLKAPDCQASLEPISVTAGGYVEFQVSERHRRRQVLRTLYFNEQRKRREVGDGDYSASLISRRHHREQRNVHAGSLSPRNSISVSFRTVAQFGYLLVAATNNDFTTLTVYFLINALLSHFYAFKQISTYSFNYSDSIYIVYHVYIWLLLHYSTADQNELIAISWF